MLLWLRTQLEAKLNVYTFWGVWTQQLSNPKPTIRQSLVLGHFWMSSATYLRNYRVSEERLLMVAYRKDREAWRLQEVVGSGFWFCRLHHLFADKGARMLRLPGPKQYVEYVPATVRLWARNGQHVEERLAFRPQWSVMGHTFPNHKSTYILKRL